MAADKLKGTAFLVSDQVQRAVWGLHRSLIPELKQKRQEGYDAILSYDKLIISRRWRDVLMSYVHLKVRLNAKQTSHLNPTQIIIMKIRLDFH